MIFKKLSVALVIAVLLTLMVVNIAGCSGDINYAVNPVTGEETLAQVSTIDAILGGVYDGVISYGELRGYGDFGIGTFSGLDGEMLAFDGDYYQIKADGVAYPVADTLKTPFAAVTFFDVDIVGEVPVGSDWAGFQKYLDGILPTENTFYAVRVEGIFSYMKTRSVPAQEKPYPLLTEVTKNQPVFEFKDVTGTMVGFRCPPYAAGINVPGYHLHFLTEDRDAGGHVLEFTVQSATVSVDNTRDFLMILPEADSDFYGIDLTPDKQEELEEAEK